MKHNFNFHNYKLFVKVSLRYDVIVSSKRHPKSMYKAPVIRKFLSLYFT
jgi:hypothetical protein